MEIMGKIVELLTPLESEERMRIISAVLTFLGEKPVSLNAATSENKNEEINTEMGNLSARARTWIKQNSITKDQLDQVFHVENGIAEIIAASVPGKNNKEKTLNAYILTGAAKLLATGEPNFDDKSARAFCETSGCYDNANHAATLKNKGNEFTGNKDKGWTLTAPGLKAAAILVQELNK